MEIVLRTIFKASAVKHVVLMRVSSSSSDDINVKERSLSIRITTSRLKLGLNDCVTGTGRSMSVEITAVIRSNAVPYVSVVKKMFCRIYLECQKERGGSSIPGISEKSIAPIIPA